MAQGLAAHLTTFKKNVKKILEDGAREAMKTTYVADGGNDVDPAISNRIQKEINQAADKWAKEFSDQVAEKLCDEINDHIKEMWIIISSPTPANGTALANSMGPVSGVITVPYTDFNVL